MTTLLEAARMARKRLLYSNNFWYPPIESVIDALDAAIDAAEKEQPKKLTDEEIDAIWNEHIVDLGEQALIDSFRSAARAIEEAVRK